MTTSGAPVETSRSLNNFSTSSRLAASQLNVFAPVALANSASFPAERAASATCIPSLAKARASEADSPAPAPTMRAVLKFTVLLLVLAGADPFGIGGDVGGHFLAAEIH